LRRLAVCATQIEIPNQESIAHDRRAVVSSLNRFVLKRLSVDHSGRSWPVRESFGGFLLRIPNAADAEGLFRNDLERNRPSGRSPFCLMQSLKGQKKIEAAARAQREFETSRKNADTKLSV
jgi:hypothetical protein